MPDLGQSCCVWESMRDIRNEIVIVYNDKET